jgi:hypothetical protein
MNMPFTLKTLVIGLIFLVAGVRQTYAQVPGQQIKWLRVGSLRSWYSSVGSEIEIGRTGALSDQMDGLIWPAQFPQQNTEVAKGIWIGAANYYDPALQTTFTAKVIGVGPRPNNADPVYEVMPVGFVMYGNVRAPNVVVDGAPSTDNLLNDLVDQYLDTLKCDRMIVSVCNTSMGITITRRIMAFSQQNNDNYFITDYTFKNTGIIDRQGTVYSQTLSGVYFFWENRVGYGEEGFRHVPPTPLNDISWGRNTVNQVIGTDPTAPSFTNPSSPDYGLRANYSWYGRHSLSPFDDLGLPAYWTGGDGHLTAAQYGGWVTIHADASAQDKLDDLTQPRSTPFMGADDAAGAPPFDAPQFDDPRDPARMLRRYTMMKWGHVTPTHADQVGNGFANTWGASNAGAAGGFEQGAGYGPYTLAPGDSVHIVRAEAVAGLSHEMCYKVGTHFLSGYNSPSTFSDTLPNGTITNDPIAYKNAWVQTGVDSIKATLRRAVDNYRSNLSIPQPPPPPGSFDVESGGDRVRMTWTNDAEADPVFNGYAIYRAIGRPDTTYTKIFSCDKSNSVLTFDDVTARRGFDYYYYIVSKDNGSRTGGVPLVSSKFYTITNTKANLRRQAIRADSIGTTIRVVPNPFDARSRSRQFGSSNPDRIAFFGLPGSCTIKIYTERGDLVRTLQHNNGSGDEYWDSTTEFRQVVVSGVYIAVFTTPDGQSVIRKFIIIR